MPREVSSFPSPGSRTMRLFESARLAVAQGYLEMYRSLEPDFGRNLQVTAHYTHTAC
jgi:hypothetical protein